MKLLTKKFEPTVAALDTSVRLNARIKNARGKVRLHEKFWSGTRRHMTLIETCHDRICDFLRLLNCKYTTGNDAKRGGVEGDYIEVKVTDVKKAILKFEKLFQAYARTPRELKKQLAYTE